MANCFAPSAPEAKGGYPCLYKDPLLDDDPYGKWAEAERAYLQERALSALLRLGGLAEALGYQEVAKEAYARALKLGPILEEARRRLLALKE